MKWTLALLAAVALLGACGTDEGEVRADGGVSSASAASTPSAGTGTIRLGIDAGVGTFIHGFDVALRFETAAGDTIGATTWIEFVLDQSGPDASIAAFYEAQLDQVVPAGPVVLLARTYLGNEDGTIEPVDPHGELPCRLEIDMAPGDLATVDIDFTEPAACLRRADEAAAPATTTAPAYPPSTPTTSPTSTSAVETSLPASQSTEPTPTAPTVGELPVGSQHYVDVDIVCDAFELAGSTWTLVEGDPSSWQPPGERHEGGTFTIDTAATGTFRGDYEGVKSATFRRLTDGESPLCAPQPR